MDTERKYDAFISYRHLPTDEAVAERLQVLLENYRPPKGAGSGKRITRIFRDKTELPTSGDLSHALREALLNSDYLIIVLSEQTKESKWCMEEIRSFKAAHGGKIDRILPILVSGEPADAIPEELRYEGPEDGTEREEIEPLCCDIRAEDDRARMRRLRTEFLRLAAPMLGCGFDDLYRRHRRRQQQRGWAIAGVVLALAAVYAGILLQKNAELRERNEALRSSNEALESANATIQAKNGELEDANGTIQAKNTELEDANRTLREQKEELQRNESRLLSESAALALENGEFYRALEEARSALPTDAGDDRPYCAAAERVLWDALYDSNNYILSTEAQHEGEVCAFQFSADGARVYTLDSLGTARCFETGSGALCWASDLPLDATALSYRDVDFLLSEQAGCLLIEGRLDLPDVYLARTGVLSVELETGALRWVSHEQSYTEGKLVLSGDGTRLIYQAKQTDYQPYRQNFVLDLETGEWTERYAPGEQLDTFSQSMVLYGTQEGVFAGDDPSRFAGVYYEKTESGTYRRHFYVMDLEAHRWDDVYVDERAAEDRMRALRFDSGSGTLLAVCDGQDPLCAAELLCLDVASGALRWSAETPSVGTDAYGENPRWIIYPLRLLYDEEGLLLLGRRQKLYAFDLSNGALLAENCDGDGVPERFSGEVTALYWAGEGICGAVLDNGYCRLGRLTDEGIRFSVSGSITETEQVLILGDGLYHGELTERYVQRSPGSGTAALVPKNAPQTLRLCRYYVYEPDWSALGQYAREGRVIPLSMDGASGLWDGGIEFLEKEYLGDLQYAYTLVRADTVSGEFETLRFVSKKELAEYTFYLRLGEWEQACLVPFADGGGLLVDDGYGSLLLVRAGSEEPEVLYGHADRLDSLSKNRQDAQGELFGSGAFSVAARRSADGAAIGAVRDGERMRLWIDGEEQSAVALPEELDWQRTVGNTSYRVWLTGSNGFVLLSDFLPGSDGNQLRGFACYDTAAGRWTTLEDEAQGRADRPLALARTEPLLAAADEDHFLRLYDLNAGTCDARLSLPVSLNALSYVGFSQDDRYVFACTNQFDNQIFIYRVADGKLVYRDRFHNYRFQSPICLISDEARGRLLIQFCTDYNACGYLLETDGWTLLAEIDDLCGYDPASGVALFYSYSDGMVLRTLPSLEDLIDRAKGILEELSGD